MSIPSLSDNALHDAAILLRAIGEKHASTVFQHLSISEIEQIGEYMSSMSVITQKQADKALMSFIHDANEITGLAINTKHYMRNTLVSAFGQQKALHLIERLSLGQDYQSLESLRWMDANVVADILRDEHPQVQSLILAHLDAKEAAKVLNYFLEEQVEDIIWRLATMKSVRSQALSDLDTLIAKQSDTASDAQPVQVGGVNSAAAILSHLDGQLSHEVMAHLREIDPSMTDQLQEELFGFDDLELLPDKHIKALLSVVSQDQWVNALKVVDKAVKDKVLSNLASEEADKLNKAMELVGAVRLANIEAAQQLIVDQAKELLGDRIRYYKK